MAYIPLSQAMSRLQQFSQGLRHQDLSQDEWNRAQKAFPVENDQIDESYVGQAEDALRQEHESFLARQQRLNQQPPQEQQPPAQTQQHPNPWQQWGLDPSKNVNPGMQGTRDQAMQGLQYVAKSELGRELTGQELNDLANSITYKGDGPVSGEQYNKGLAFVRGLKPPGGGQQGGGTTGPAALPPHIQTMRPEYSQFIAPNITGIDNGVGALVSRLLANPETMDETTVNRMKMMAKENAIAQAESARNAARSRRAAMGWTEGGGTAGLEESIADQQLIDSIMSNNRAIDANALATNRGDILNAIQMAEGVATGRAGRTSDLFRTALSGQMAQSDSDFRRDQLAEDTRRFDSDYGLRRSDFNLRDWLAHEGVGLDRDRFNETKDQFRIATGMDLARFLESIRQFDSTFGENQRQFNNRTAFDYSALNQNNQSSLLNFINSLFTRR